MIEKHEIKYFIENKLYDIFLTFIAKQNPSIFLVYC